MRILIMSVLALCVWTTAHAKEIEKVNFPEETTAGAQKLVLNGVGLRTKKRLGMNFKVYVAGLWVTAKNADANELIKSPTPKVLELVFLRSVDRETLQEAWAEGFGKNCKADCDAAKDQLKAFNDSMVDVRENTRVKMSFEKDGVKVDINNAKTNKNAHIEGEAFKRALLAIFIGDEPPTPELKAGLLGK